MFKVDKIKNSFDCDLCNKLLVDPVVMACGNFICKCHLDKLLKNTSNEKNNFVCGICQEEHTIPKKGFMVNNRLQGLLEFELNTLEASPFFDECRKEIEQAQSNVTKIELLKKNSENYIYEYFEDIKRQVDIRREDLKFKVDKYSDDIIKSVESSQMNFIKLSKEVNEITTNIEKSKTALGEFVVQFDTLKFNDKKFEEVKKGVTVVNQEFSRIINEYNSSLIGNKKYTFQFDELAIENIFGRLIDTQCFDMDSTILDEKNKAANEKLCEFPKETKWKLQYRASRDGFTAQNFHAKCDNVANTLTVIKSTNGNIFGGFTEKPWINSVGQYVVDPKAFIYSLINKENRPFKVVCSNNGTNAIYCNSTYGPTFGGGHDLHITSGSNVNQTSYSNFGSSYQHPEYQNTTTKAKNILAGSYNFQTLEIEVFTKAN